MAIKGTFYVFTRVSVLERSKKFFGETLGWKLGTEDGSVAGFSFGDGYLVLHQDKGDPRKAAGMLVAVKVDHVDAPHARLTNLVSKSARCRTSPGASGTFNSPILTGTPGFTARLRDPDRHP
jgi:catechol 2,3-dioxygenase-like lactoylglutathione lyase family enzyme